MKNEWLLRREIVSVGRRLYERNLVSATDGNISARLGDGILVTPAGSCLGELQPQDLLYVDLTASPPLHRPSSRFAGGVLCPLPAPPRPTSELPMHRAAYAVRPGIGAIVHAHPPMATALTVAGLSLAQPVLPEVVATLGSIPTASYATPSTEETADAVRELIRDHDAILLDRHGAVTVGTDPLDAFRKLEKLEQCARIVITSHALGGVRTLSPEQIARLAALTNAAERTRPEK
jgi:L-fuculose-phosphate aldolase